MTTAACPRCHDEITLPTRGRPESRVQCPLCLEEMRLEEVLSSVPPMLILLDHADQHEPEHETTAGWSSATEPGYEMADAPEKEEFLGGGIGAATTTVGSPTASIAASPPRVKKQPSIILEGIKVVLGGAFGIVLAIVVLWWLPGGYAKDIFNVGPTVAKYVPQIVPEPFRTAETTGTPKKNTTKGNNNSSSNSGNGQSSKGSTDIASNLPKIPENPFKVPNVTEPPSTPIDPAEMPADPNDPLAALNPPTLPGEETPETPPEVAPENPVKPNPNKTPTPEPNPEPTPEPTPTENSAGVTKLADDLTAAKEALTAFEGVDPAADRATRQKLGTELFDAAGRVGVAAVHVDARDSAAAPILETMPGYLKSITDTPGKVSMIGFLAGQRLENAADPDKEHGIVCIGTVKDIRVAGKGFEMDVILATKNMQPVVVVTKENPQDTVKVDGKVVIAGEVTEEAAKLVKGYNGAPGMVVVGGYLLPLE
jgi:hypothetical protein